jgi:acetyl esterase/lipase
MIISLLCILRDEGLPLPAGATLISPWVDLAHSFPSIVGPSDGDYIPPGVPV